MGNAAVNQISRPTCSGRDRPVGPASPPSPSSLNSPSPNPSLHGALKWEGRWGLKGYSRKRGAPPTCVPGTSRPKPETPLNRA